MEKEGNITRRRKGCVTAVVANGRRYWMASLTVGGRHFAKESRDRAVCEEWLDGMVERHPVYTYDSNRAKAWKTRRRNGRDRGPHRYPAVRARFAVAVECDPMTAHWHIHVRKDWRMPERIVVYDNISEAPVVWVIDDNGGAGWSRSAVERRMAQLPPLAGGSYAARRMDTLRYRRQWDN